MMWRLLYVQDPPDPTDVRVDLLWMAPLLFLLAAAVWLVLARGIRMAGNSISRTEVRTFSCCICKGSMLVESSTTTHPEAPEMMRIVLAGTGPRSEAWFGVIKGDAGPEVIFTCSHACTDALLSEGDASSPEK